MRDGNVNSNIGNEAKMGRFNETNVAAVVYSEDFMLRLLLAGACGKC